jgi:hypothetical protein
MMHFFAPYITRMHRMTPMTRIGQAPGLEQYPRAVCKGVCDVWADQGLGSGVLGRLTSLTPVRVIDVLPSGFSRVIVESGLLAGKYGLIHSSDLVQAPLTRVSVEPLTLPPVPTATARPGPIGPFVPGANTIGPAPPPLPSPIQPVPEPPPVPPPGSTPGTETGTTATGTSETPPTPMPGTEGAMTAAPSGGKPWYATAGEIALLTSPAWGLILLSALTRER